MHRTCQYAALAVLFLGTFLIGCNVETSDPMIDEIRQQFLLSEEPSDPLGILAAREQKEFGKQQAFVGRVKEYVDKEAAFWIVDTTGDGHGHAGHDHDNCPYCKAKKESGLDPTAVVKLDVGDAKDGSQVLKGLGIEPGKMVVVKGTAELDDTLGLLTIHATGVHVRE